MKLILFVLVLLTSISCAHHHNDVKHHHHEFDKKCAYEVSQNHFDVEGKEEFKIKHEGETYYFSSAEKMKEFQSNINENVKKSKSNWKTRRHR